MREVTRHCKYIFSAKRAFFGDPLDQFFGPADEDTPEFKGVGKQLAFAIDEAHGWPDRQAVGPKGVPDCLDLPSHIVDQFGLATTANIELMVYLEPATNVSGFDQPFSKLGVDDPHSGRRD